MQARWLDIQAVALFISVVETKSVKQTAKKFGLASSTVSQNIQSLEQFLGVRLLDRQIRPLQPTMRGRYFFTEAKGWLEKAQTLPECFAKEHQRYSAVRIGWGATIGQMVAPWWMGELTQKIKNLRISSVPLDRLYLGFQEKRFDMVLAPEKEGVVVDGIIDDIFEEYYWIVTRKGVAPIQTIQDIRALAQKSSFVVTRAVAAQPDLLHRFIQMYDLRAYSTMHVDTSRVAMGAVAQKAGWTLLTPTDMCRAPEFWGDVAIHPIVSPWLMRRQRVMMQDRSLKPLAQWLKMQCQTIVTKQLEAPWRKAFATETKEQDFCHWL